MKINITNCGLILIPENDYDKKCLKEIDNECLTTKRENDWDKTGNLYLNYESHPWDRS